MKPYLLIIFFFSFGVHKAWSVGNLQLCSSTASCTSPGDTCLIQCSDNTMVCQTVPQYATRRIGSLGCPCSPDPTVCLTGTKCSTADSNTCQLALKLGDSCINTNDLCGAGLMCAVDCQKGDTFHCLAVADVPSHAEGATGCPCSSSSDCTTTFCAADCGATIGQTCQASASSLGTAGAEGCACDPASSNCVSPLVCVTDPSTGATGCLAKPTISQGQPCVPTNSFCNATLVCRALCGSSTTTCEPIIVSPNTAAGEQNCPCTPGTSSGCNSGLVCVAPIAGGSPTCQPNPNIATGGQCNPNTPTPFCAIPSEVCIQPCLASTPTCQANTSLTGTLHCPCNTVSSNCITPLVCVQPTSGGGSATCENMPHLNPGDQCVVGNDFCNSTAGYMCRQDCVKQMTTCQLKLTSPDTAAGAISCTCTPPGKGICNNGLTCVTLINGGSSTCQPNPNMTLSQQCVATNPYCVSGLVCKPKCFSPTTICQKLTGNDTATGTAGCPCGSAGQMCNTGLICVNSTSTGESYCDNPPTSCRNPSCATEAFVVLIVNVITGLPIISQIRAVLIVAIQLYCPSVLIGLNLGVIG